VTHRQQQQQRQQDNIFSDFNVIVGNDVGVNADAAKARFSLIW
jgi:hypothetical protein